MAHETPAERQPKEDGHRSARHGGHGGGREVESFGSKALKALGIEPSQKGPADFTNMARMPDGKAWSTAPAADVLEEESETSSLLGCFDRSANAPALLGDLPSPQEPC